MSVLMLKMLRPSSYLHRMRAPQAGMVPMRAEAEAARKLASLPDSHPPQQMQPHPNKRVCGQRRVKSLSHSHPLPFPSIAGASKGPGGTEDSDAVSLWGRASSVCSIRSVRTSCFLLPGLILVGQKCRQSMCSVRLSPAERNDSL